MKVTLLVVFLALLSCSWIQSSFAYECSRGFKVKVDCNFCDCGRGIIPETCTTNVCEISPCAPGQFRKDNEGRLCTCENGSWYCEF